MCRAAGVLFELVLCHAMNYNVCVYSMQWNWVAGSICHKNEYRLRIHVSGQTNFRVTAC